MRIPMSLRVVLALASLVLAVVLPPAILVARYLPEEYASRGEALYQGLWLFKLALGLNAVLWLVWPAALRVLDASRSTVAEPKPAEHPGPLAPR